MRVIQQTSAQRVIPLHRSSIFEARVRVQAGQDAGVRYMDSVDLSNSVSQTELTN